MTSSTSGNEDRLALLLFAIIFCYGFFCNAWIAEDAFINFRVIENFLSGQGLVWNVGERVQVFTSPLWMLLTTAGIAVTGEFFYTTVFLSFGLTVLTLYNLYFCSGRASVVFLPMAALLLLTRCFVNYSSSGLETPLVALTLSTFLHLWCQLQAGPDRTFLLTLLASLCAITRHDTVLLTAPFVLQQVAKSIDSVSLGSCAHQARQIFVGALPLIAWTVFSLLYYGSPVPNTANAKIVPSSELLDTAGQAIQYFEYLQHFDPMALCLIGFAVVVSATYRSRHSFPLVVSLTLFAAYLFYIGGDYMAGRFLMGPLVMSAVIAANIFAGIVGMQDEVVGKQRTTGRQVSLMLLFVPLISLAVSHLTPMNICEYMRAKIVDGIADERGIYYGYTDFFTVAQFGVSHPFRTKGEQIRRAIGSERVVVISCHIGMVGFYAGPGVYIVDPLALSDSFLARTPLRSGTQRIGHFERYVPRQYIQSIITGRNSFSHSLARQYYEDILQATRKPLISRERLNSLLRLNSRYYNGLDKLPVSDLGGPVLIDGETSFVMHSCLGGQKTPVYILGEKDVGANRIRRF